MTSVSKKYLLSKWTLLFFKIIGLAPFAMREPAKAKGSSMDTWQACAPPRFINSRSGSLYNCTLISIQLCLCLLSIPVMSEVPYPGKSEMTVMIEICLTICGNSVVIVIWLTYFVKRNTLVILVNRLTDVDVTLDRVNGAIIASSKDKHGSRNCIVQFATYILAWIQLLLSERLAFRAPLQTWFSFVFPSVIVNWFIVQYVLALKLVENRLRYLNRVLHDCSINSIVFPLRSFLIDRVAIDDLQVPKIVSLRRAHTCLYEISSGAADFYSLPILMAVGFVCFLSFYNAYYLIAPFVLDTEKPTIWATVNSVLWLLVLLTPIALLAAGVNGVTAEMRRTADVIPDLLARRTTSRQDRIELQMFSFELMHKDVEFTAYKFFPLDGTLLRSVFGMICTYLTIVFQLQVESSSSATRTDRNITNPITRASQAPCER